MSEGSIDEIRQTFITYLDTYFVERNLKATLETFRPDITGFGTGVDEIAHGLGEFRTLYTRDLSEAPNPVYYQIDYLDIKAYAESGIASCQLNIQTEILNQELKINQLRLSMFFIRADGEWQIAHMHISLPTQAHAEDEAYPVKELEERNKVLQRLVDERTEKLNQAIHEISILAMTDKLTGIYNRLKIDECLNFELQRSIRYGNKLCLIMIDIDYFKHVNDEYGHLTGDQVLADFANLISSRIRKTDFLGRWGGEEFLIICPETDMGSAIQMAETIRSMVQTHEFLPAGSLTASFGVSPCIPNDDRDALISRADTALYDAKRNGRNRVVAL